MNILSFQSNDLIINGLISALVVAGHNCNFVKPNKTLFDAFFEYKPDVFITTPGNINNVLQEAVKRFNVKAVQISDNHYEGFISYAPKPAANLAQLIGMEKDILLSEFAYIMLEQPNANTVEYIEHFIYPNFSRQLKIFGFELPYHSYIGPVSSMADIGNILRSTEYLLDYTNNLVMDAWMNHSICVPYRSNPVLFPTDIFGRYEHPHELEEQLNKFDDPLFTSKKRTEARSWILDNNTFFHRTSELFKLIGMDKEADKCLNTLEELKKSPKLAC